MCCSVGADIRSPQEHQGLDRGFIPKVPEAGRAGADRGLHTLERECSDRKGGEDKGDWERG